MKNNTIGLFGTCGNSTWRDSVMAILTANNLEFFNPNKANWDPSDAVIEAEHKATDGTMVFAITDETYGTASLAECGMALLKATLEDEKRNVVIYIAPEPQESLKENAQAWKESRNARKIVLADLETLTLPNFRLVKSMEEMMFALGEFTATDLTA